MGGTGTGGYHDMSQIPGWSSPVSYRPDPEYLERERLVQEIREAAENMDREAAKKRREERRQQREKAEKREIKERLQAARKRGQVWPGALANAYLAKGFKAAPLAALGFTPKELHQGGFSVAELLGVFSISRLEKAGIKVKVKELKPDQILKDLDSA